MRFLHGLVVVAFLSAPPLITGDDNTNPHTIVNMQTQNSVVYVNADSDGQVQITINGVNDPPVAVDDEFTTPANQPIMGNLLANDSDPDNGDTLRLIEINNQPVEYGVPITLPSGAILTVQENGDFTYDPNGAFDSLGEGVQGGEALDYKITDQDGEPI